MQFRFRSDSVPARRAPGFKKSRRSNALSSRRLRLESLETRAMLAAVSLVTETTTARAFVPTAPASCPGQVPAGPPCFSPDLEDMGFDWTGSDAGFDDSGWTPTVGPNGVGYDSVAGSVEFDPFIGLDVETAMRLKSATALVRIPFTASDVETLQSLSLNVRFDDGFIAWLNGVEVLRQKSPVDTSGNPAYPFIITGAGSRSVAPAPTAEEAKTLQPFDISQHLSALVNGNNVLAIRGFNISELTSDFLIQATLTGTTPDAPFGVVDDTASIVAPATSTVIDVLANDSGGTAGINPTSVQIVDQPANGTVVVSPTTGQISYTAAPGFSGTDTFTYRVRDRTPSPTPGGVISPITVVSTTALHQRLVPTATDAGLGTTWTTPTFVPTGWTTAAGGIGYDNDPTYLPYIGDNIGALTSGLNATAYMRVPFTLTDPTLVQQLRLRMRYDDGFIAYINGVEVARANAPAVLAWNSQATATHDDALAVNQIEFPIPLTGLTLLPGTGANILAIHALNSPATSSDFLAQPELIADSGTTGVWADPPATVTVNVKGLGPTAVPDSAWVQQNGTQFPNSNVTVDVLANDTVGTSNSPINPGTVRIANQPANGTVEVDPATGQITYYPNAGYVGDDVFTYTVRDNFPRTDIQRDVVVFAPNTAWKYLDTGTDQGTAWSGRTFNDASWSSGNAPLGYPGGTTVVGYGGNANNKFITTYFRKSFNVVDASQILELTLNLTYDDGAVIYINGTEVGRVNMPAGAVTYQTLAPAAANATVQILLTGAQLAALRDGENILGVEIHQTAITSSDILFNLGMTADIAPEPGYPSNPAEVRIHVNAPPVAGNDNVTIGPQGGGAGAISNTITFNPLANDTDPDNSPSNPPGKFGINPETVVITQQPRNMTVPNGPAGRITNINPTTGEITYVGEGLSNPRTITFQYTVKDHRGAVSAPATVTVTVSVNAPQAVADTIVTPENTPITVDVVANDVRRDLTIATGVSRVTIVTPPAYGTVVANSDGTVTYTPNPGFRDQFDTFEYRTQDTSLNPSNTATVTVDVFSRAVARPDGVALNQGETVLLIPFADLWANDSYPSTFQPAVVVVPNSATKGTATVVTQNGQQFVQFTKATGATGVATFSYYLQDVVPSPTRPNSNNALVSVALGAINISGKVYVDVNRDNVHNPGETLVPDATIVLTRAGDPTFRVTTRTGSDSVNDPANYGQYSFVSTSAGVLPPDVYTITQIQPSMYLDFTSGAVNSYTVNLTEPNNPGYDFREWTVNPQFFTMLASYGGGFLASQQPVSLSANSIVVPYDQGWNGAFTAKATYDAALGPVSVKLYNSAGAVVANSATNPNSTAGNAVVNYSASPSQKLVLVVSGTNPNVSIESPNLGTAAGDTMAPYVVNTSLSSSRWSSEFRENLAGSYFGNSGYNVDAGETLPWQGLDEITMRFTEPVSVTQQDLRLWGVAVPDYRTEVGIQSFHYDPMTFTAKWTLSAPIATDQLRVGMSDAVRDVWGNRVGGTGYSMLFNVLPGAVQASSGILSSEAAMAEMISRQFARIGSEKYAAQFDFDGNGTINFVDAITLRNASGSQLPAGTPGSGTTSGPGSTPSPQAPAAVIATAPRNVAAGVTETPRLAATSTTTTVRRQISRGTRAAAVDVAVSTGGDAGSNTSTTSSLSAIRARRSARTVDQVLAGLGSM